MSTRGIAYYNIIFNIRLQSYKHIPYYAFLLIYYITMRKWSAWNFVSKIHESSQPVVLSRDSTISIR